MHLGGYEPPILEKKRTQTCALDRRASGIGRIEQQQRRIQISIIAEYS